jgi:hypothetical protein
MGACATKPEQHPDQLLAAQMEGWAAETLINTWGFKHLKPAWQTALLAKIALKAMPDLPNPEDAIKTLVSEAIHFRRGIREYCFVLPLPY